MEPQNSGLLFSLDCIRITSFACYSLKLQYSIAALFSIFYSKISIQNGMHCSARTFCSGLFKPCKMMTLT